MPEKIAEGMVVRDLAVKYPWARQILEAFGIDYCCRGGRALEEAAADGGDLKSIMIALNGALSIQKEAGLDSTLTAMNEALPGLGRGPVIERDWPQATLNELVDHILSCYHVRMRTEMTRLMALMERVRDVHGKRHVGLLDLTQRLVGFKREIVVHLAKEELFLFPWVRRLEGDRDTCLGPRVDLSMSIREMESEHLNANRTLAEMRAMTLSADMPVDSCSIFSKLCEGLRALERDLHEHMHFENNLLFPKAVALGGDE